MEGFQSACPPLVLCAPAAAMAAAPGGVCWAKRETRFVTPRGLNYLELCKAILAQAGPATVTCTRECGVQVNAKVDKTVQCSLGPKTLLGQGEGDRLQSEEEEEEEEEELCVGGQASCTPPPVSQFFLTTRPVSIYSRVFDRRESREKAEVREQEGEEGGEHPDDDHKPPVHQDNKGSNLQKYGFFHCKKCNIRWESAYVWCISGTNKVYYKQLCRKCQVGFNPYRVESIICKGCSETCCICEKKQRHINMTRPHRQDLCCRCRGMKLSCDATYSFKYIF
ncbi:ZAR1-like protein isoform X3 [Corythoichthys intestinalis]|uniref:ZAR1-like protein isoform X3 n=1 Tax=Corythoichthys intestinalis TaxID=161448 RepID=UPI0025A622C0|nr:ZAR1-like protein isoform X3 [Corythoichthys intestinalis]